MNRQEWQRRQQSAAPTASDIDAVRHNELVLTLAQQDRVLIEIRAQVAELLKVMHELVADRERERLRFEGDGK